MSVDHPHIELDPEALAEAAEWLMCLSDSEVTPEQQAQWAAWRNSSAERAQAWARAELLMGKLGGLPPALSLSALDRPSDPGRRQAITRLAVLLALAPASWAGWQMYGQGWAADYRSAVGQRRDVTLADGTQLILNTDTAIDVCFGANERFIRLYRGEILVQTAPDIVVPARPLRVGTGEGVMQALGTRFSVRERQGRTYLAVLEGAVRVQPASAGQAQGRVVAAGEQADFDGQGVGPNQALDSAGTLWTQGMLLADNMRLDELLGELARYQRGFIRCDRQSAGLRVSGAFPISDRRRTLGMLQATYGLAVEERMGGYWTLVSAR
ncbi:FecR domain-containing protein [Pseudomonas oryziphila]|nr:FecR family protein [Pseudomonas oryziphila]